MKDYLSIREFARLSGIETTTLRYWDEIGLFSPMKRDPENNYRYYTPDQMIAVNFISVLSGLQIPLKSIQDVSASRTPDRIARLIEQQERQLDQEIRRLQECHSIIHARLELINYGTRVREGYQEADGLRAFGDPDASPSLNVNTDTIAVLYREEKAFVLGPPAGFEEGKPFYEPFIRFIQAAEDLRINLSYPIGGYHQNMDNFIKAPGAPDHFYSLDPTGNRRWVEGKYLVGFSHGYYGELGDVAERMRSYAAKQRLRLSGPVYTLYLHDEICIADPGDYMCQVFVAVDG